jgi:hemerythrin superfamily protein
LRPGKNPKITQALPAFTAIQVHLKNTAFLVRPVKVRPVKTRFYCSPVFEAFKSTLLNCPTGVCWLTNRDVIIKRINFPAAIATCHSIGKIVMVATAKKSSTDTKSHKSQEATALLRADHKLVDGLFEEYENARTVTQKRALVQKICQELTIHAQIEEEIFYPVVKKALKDHDLVPEATVEHDTLKFLIGQLLSDDIADDKEMYDAKVKVLSEYVKHHVKEEQTELFPKVKETKIDLLELGAQLQQRKEELQASLH